MLYISNSSFHLNTKQIKTKQNTTYTQVNPKETKNKNKSTLKIIFVNIKIKEIQNKIQ